MNRFGGCELHAISSELEVGWVAGYWRQRKVNTPLLQGHGGKAESGSKSLRTPPSQTKFLAGESVLGALR